MGVAWCVVLISSWWPGGRRRGILEWSRVGSLRFAAPRNPQGWRFPEKKKRPPRGNPWEVACGSRFAGRPGNAHGRWPVLPTGDGPQRCRGNPFLVAMHGRAFWNAIQKCTCHHSPAPPKRGAGTYEKGGEAMPTMPSDAQSWPPELAACHFDGCHVTYRSPSCIKVTL